MDDVDRIKDRIGEVVTFTVVGCTEDVLAQGVGLNVEEIQPLLDELTADGKLLLVDGGYITPEELSAETQQPSYLHLEAALDRVGYRQRELDWAKINEFSEQARPFMDAFLHAVETSEVEGKVWGRIFAGLYLTAEQVRSGRESE